jgi:predicted transcriptional regulator
MRTRGILCPCGHEKFHHTGPNGTCVYGSGTLFGGCIWCQGWNKAIRTGITPVDVDAVLARAKSRATGQSAEEILEGLRLELQRALDTFCAGVLTLLAPVRGQAAEDGILEMPPPVVRSMGRIVPDASNGIATHPVRAELGKSEAMILTLIAQNDGRTPAQLAIATTLRKRSIQNILTALKASGYIEKSDKRFVATAEGKDAIKDTFVPLEKGAVLKTLSEGERALLFAIAACPSGATSAMLGAMLSAYKKRTRQNMQTTLKTRELIEKRGGRVFLSEAAREEIGDAMPKPLAGPALRNQWRAELPKGESVVFEALEQDEKDGLTVADLAEVTTYAPRTVQNILTALKAREIAEKTEAGRFRLAPHLFART